MLGMLYAHKREHFYLILLQVHLLLLPLLLLLLHCSVKRS